MEDSPVRQISESPEERDPYLRKLATHLAVQLDDQRVPSISTLKQTVAVTLELRLLPSGALTRAQVVDSTGIESLDEVAYKAALAASPYPSPEGETTDRFRVQLLFTPKRS
jgi:protein TonB